MLHFKLKWRAAPKKELRAIPIFVYLSNKSEDAFETSLHAEICINRQQRNGAYDALTSARMLFSSVSVTCIKCATVLCLLRPKYLRDFSRSFLRSVLT